MDSFSARHVTHHGSFLLPLPVNEAFPLFTAEGERRWVPGWEPTYLHPSHPSHEAGTVFRTAHDGDDTIWLVLEYDAATSSAAYARVAPASRAGTVRVQCVGAGERSTEVHVSYALTALTPDGNATLAALTPAAYRGMLEEWRALIHDALGLPSI